MKAMKECIKYQLTGRRGTVRAQWKGIDQSGRTVSDALFEGVNQATALRTIPASPPGIV